MSFFPALLLLCFSIERYFGICFPLQSRVRRRRLLVYLIPVIFTWYHDLYFGPKSDVMIITAALCTTFLNWWSWLAMGSWTLRSLMTRCMPRYAIVCRIGIADVCQGKIFSHFLLSFSNSHHNQIYKQYMDFFFTALLPLLGLIIFNTRVYCAMKRHRR